MRVGLAYVNGPRRGGARRRSSREREANGPLRAPCATSPAASTCAATGSSGWSRPAPATRSGARRRLLWELGLAPRPRGPRGGGRQLALDLRARRERRRCPQPGEWDAARGRLRAATGLSVREHPIAALRRELDARSRSADLATLPTGTPVALPGLAIARQRPASANGIVFLLLEDEHGMVNLILFPAVYERTGCWRAPSRCSDGHGTLERRERNLNVIVETLEPLDAPGHRTLRRRSARRDAAAVAQLREVAPPAQSFAQGARVAEPSERTALVPAAAATLEGVAAAVSVAPSLARRILPLTLGHAAVDFTQGAVPALIPYLHDAFHLSYTADALIFFAMTVSSSITQPIFGHFADRGEQRLLLPGAVVVAGLGLAGCALAPRYLLALVATFVAGLGVAAYHPEASRRTSEIAGAQRATGMAYFSVGGNVGFAAGPALAGLVAAQIGLGGGFLLAAPALAVASLLATRTLTNAAGRSRAGAGGTGGADDRRSLGILLGALGLRGYVYFGLLAFIPLFEEHARHRSAGVRRADPDGDAARRRARDRRRGPSRRPHRPARDDAPPVAARRAARRGLRADRERPRRRLRGRRRRERRGHVRALDRALAAVPAVARGARRGPLDRLLDGHRRRVHGADRTARRRPRAEAALATVAVVAVLGAVHRGGPARRPAAPARVRPDLHNHYLRAGDIHAMTRAAVAAGVDELASPSTSSTSRRRGPRAASSASASSPRARRSPMPPTSRDVAVRRGGGADPRALGIELDTPARGPELEQAIAAFRAAHGAVWDVVIGSVHVIDGDQEIHTLDDLRPPVAIWRDYVERLRAAVASGLYDIVSHPVRLGFELGETPARCQRLLRDLARDAARHDSRWS